MVGFHEWSQDRQMKQEVIIFIVKFVIIMYVIPLELGF